MKLSRLTLLALLVLALYPTLPLRAATPAEIARLVEKLRTGDVDVRDAAASKLAAAGVDAAPALISLLKDKDPDVCNYAVETLRNIGPGVIPNLLAVQAHQNPQIRIGVLIVLQYFSDARGLAAVRRGFTDPDITVRLAALQTLSNEFLFDERVLTLLPPDDLAPLADAVRPLLRDADPRMRLGALLALFAISPQSVTQEAFSLVEDPDAKVRLIAVGQLSHSDDARVSGILLAAMTDPEPEVRRSAAGGLYGREEPEVINDLDTLLQHKDANVRGNALLALRDARAPILPRIAPLLADQATREGACDVLETYGEQAVPYLRPLLDAKEDATRITAAHTLARIHGPASLEALIIALRDPLPEVWDSPMDALEAYDDPRAAEALTEQLQSKDTDKRRRAARQLAERGDERAIPVLLEMLQATGGEDDEWEQSDVVRSLAHFRSPQLLETWLKAAQSGNAGMRDAAYTLLDGYDDPRAAALFRAGLKHKLEEVRELSARGLAKHGEIATLLTTLAQGNAGEREAAATALGLVCDPQAIPALTAALKDANSDVSNTAAQALCNYRDPAVVPALLNVITGTLDSDRRTAVLEALQQIPDPRAINVLLRVAINDTRIDIPGQACAALRAIDDPAVPTAVRAQLDRLPTTSDAYTNLTAVLTEWGDPAIDPLLGLLKDPDTRCAAVMQLGAVLDVQPPSRLSDAGKERITQALLGVLHDRDIETVAAALDGLAKVSDPRIAAAVLPLLQSPQAEIRAAAVHALAVTPGQPVLDALLALRNDPVPDVHAEVCTALGQRKDPDTFPLLEDAFHRDCDTVRRAAITAIAQLDHPHVRGLLLEGLRASDETVAMAAAEGMREWPNPEAIPVIMQGLHRSPGSISPWTYALLNNEKAVAGPALDLLLERARYGNRAERLACAAALRNRPGDRVDDTLIALMNDPNYEVRWVAVESLAVRADPRAVPALLRRAQLQRDEYSEEGLYTDTPARAIELLGQLQDRRAIAPLIALLADDHGMLRQPILTALEKITGQKFGTNIAAWRAWYTAHPRRGMEETGL